MSLTRAFPMIFGVLCLGTLPDAGANSGSEELTSGQVVDQASHWSADGKRIITESAIATSSGLVRVRQLGGSKDGIGMRVVHGPAIPPLGSWISARTGSTAQGEKSIYRVWSGIANGSAVDGLRPLEFSSTRTDTGAPLYWANDCVKIQYNSGGTSHLAGDEEFDILNAVADEWQNNTQSCSYMKVVIDGFTDKKSGQDGSNVIVFEEEVWGRAEDGMLYDPLVGALTLITFIDKEGHEREGEIVDADIVLNAVHFSLSAGGNTLDSPELCLSDIANTYTHEFGHLLGLDHTCWVGSGTRPIDENGTPVPRCSSPTLSQEIRNATMYNYQDCGETKKATLSQDDIDGLCSIYPLADASGSCASPQSTSGGGCSLSSNSASGGLVLFLVLLLATRRRGL